MPAYYNEHDAYAASWLGNLAGAGLIAPGRVDGRDIRLVVPGDVRGATQAHFFAGIGVWSHALRLAGWPDDRPVWTGSCPCQPFSQVGKGLGFDDPRHLWPAWFDLIRECRPPIIFGEQIAAAAGLEWLDLVQADLEGEGYAFGSADLCAAGVGAPHARQRLFFVAHTDRPGLEVGGEQPTRDQLPTAERGRPAGIMADPDILGVPHEGRRKIDGTPGPMQGIDEERERVRSRVGEHGHARGMGDPHGLGEDSVGSVQGWPGAEREGGPTAGFWADAEWLPCRDGKWRPVEPGTFPLAHGAPARVGRLRAYGNAIVAEVAAEFIRASIEAIG